MVQTHWKCKFTKFLARVHRGQAIIEFVFVLPILLLLVMGALEFGRAYIAKIVITNAAREGAYYLSYHPDEPEEAIQAAIDEADSSGITLNEDNISILPVGCCTPGSYAEVLIAYDIELDIFQFLLGPIELTSSARMVVQ
jgi:hypothetical protein